MADMADADADQPIHVPAELSRMWDERQASFKEMTRAFAEERGLVYEPVFNYGYTEWPDEDQRAFDALTEKHTAEWAAKIDAAFPAAP